MCNNKKSSFEELLERDGSVSIQHQNIRFLAIEIFNFFKGINRQIVKKILQFRGNVAYQLRKPTDFQIQFVQSFQWYRKYKISRTKNLGVFTS